MSARSTHATHPIRRQARGRRTRERILAATERLLRDRHLENLTVGQIVREARSSIGSFYHLFGAKEALVAPLYARYDRRLTEGAERVLAPARWRGRRLAYRVERIVRYAVRLYRHERGLMRALTLHARSHPEAVTALQHAHRARLYDRVADVLLACRDEMAHEHPESAVRVGLLFVGAACRDKILFGDAPHPRSIVSDDRSLAMELSRAVLAYLRAPEDAKASTHVS